MDYKTSVQQLQEIFQLICAVHQHIDDQVEPVDIVEIREALIKASRAIGLPDIIQHHKGQTALSAALKKVKSSIDMQLCLLFVKNKIIGTDCQIFGDSVEAVYQQINADKAIHSKDITLREHLNALLSNQKSLASVEKVQVNDAVTERGESLLSHMRGLKYQYLEQQRQLYSQFMAQSLTYGQ